MKKGFTLLELLTVIAIIGLLATIVVAALNNARDKSKIASSLEFSSSVIGTIGDSTVSYWSFDDGNAIDNWGDNDGTLVDNPQSVQGVIREALEFDGDDYVNAGNDSSLDITGSMSISAWVKTSEINSRGTIVSKREDNTYDGYGLTFFNGKLSGFFRDDSPPETTLQTMTAKSYNDGKWHHVVATVFVSTTETDITRIYVDGFRDPSEDDDFGNASDFDIIGITNKDLEIGYSSTAGTSWTYFNGEIDEVRIYSEVLPLAEIQRLYAEGAEKHGIVLK